MKKPAIVFLIVVLALFGGCFSVPCIAESTLPYSNYNYSEETGEIITAPQAYVPQKVIYAKELGLSDFKDASDIFYSDDGYLYILDTGNSRVVVLNSDYSLYQVISCVFANSSDEEEKALNGAKGLFVGENYIYIADSQNARIIVLERTDGELVRVITTPKADVLDKDFIFKPIRLSVDKDGLLYVISEGTYEGILNLDAQGNFQCFFGTNNVTASAWELFWRRFSTKEQRKNMVQLIPQDFSSIDVDDDGFFLVTCYTEQESSMVKRLNPGGNNIIKNKSINGIVGDPQEIWKGSLAGVSSFIDIAAAPDNIYACLDSTRGKIFCYNYDGYMIYNFGTLADQTGGFGTPKALTYLGDGEIAVLDTQKGAITVFAPTAYGEAINKSIHYGRVLDYDKALESWKSVLSMNNNFDLAHNSIGQVYLNQGNYDEAAKEFKASGNKQSYSKAAKELQTEWIYNNIYWVCGIVVVIVLLFVSLYIVRKKIRKKIKNK